MSDPNATYSTADWAGESSRRWSAAADQLEAQLAPVSDVLFAAAALQPGERVLDVGCGRGATTRAAAITVGAAGTALGIDVSEELLEAARSLADGLDNVSFRHGDGQRIELEDGSFDVLLSRFGVMFFDDTTTAMANLGTAVRPAGRLCVAVWSHRPLNEMMQWPLDVAVDAASRLGVDLTLPDPTVGPFSWGDEIHIRSMLEETGWTDVAYQAVPVRVYLGGPATPDEALNTSLAVGPLRAALGADGVPAEIEAVVRDALQEAFAARHDGVGVPVDALPVIVTARRS